jgi:hypothetical protein
MQVDFAAEFDGAFAGIYKCRACGAVVIAVDRVCPHCGELVRVYVRWPLGRQVVRCYGCGADLGPQTLERVRGQLVRLGG